MSNPNFTFNALSAADYYFEMGREFDPLMAAQKPFVIEVPKIPGFTQLSKTFESRKIPVKGVLYASTNAELQTRLQAFKAFLYYSVDKQLIFSDRPDRYYNAQHLASLPLEKKRRFVPLELEFTCNDPFSYAVTPDIVTSSGIVTNGFTFSVTNSGQYESWPIITVTFHQAQTHIYISNNSITDCRFDITKTFNTNDVLVLDSKDTLITLNNVFTPAGFGDGGIGGAEFILLNKGANLLEIGTTDATINVDVRVWYREVYL